MNERQLIAHCVTEFETEFTVLSIKINAYLKQIKMVFSQPIFSLVIDITILDYR